MLRKHQQFINTVDDINPALPIISHSLGSLRSCRISIINRRTVSWSREQSGTALNLPPSGLDTLS